MKCILPNPDIGKTALIRIWDDGVVNMEYVSLVSLPDGMRYRGAKLMCVKTIYKSGIVDFDFFD